MNISKNDTTKNNLDTFGFSKSDRDEMQKIFASFPDIESVILFGSRAKKTFKPASDIDLALVYKKDDYRIAASVKYKLEEETKIPYFFDVLDLKTISTEELKKHIEEFGVEIYRRD